MIQKRRPKLPKPSFSFENVAFFSFAASAKNYVKWHQNPSWNDSQVLKIATRGLRKSDAENRHRNGRQQNARFFFKPNINKNSLPKQRSLGFQNGTFFDLFCKLPPGGPRTPKIMTKLQNKKTRCLRQLFMRGKPSLQLFSPWPLPAKPWEGEDGHTEPADCSGELFGGAAMTRRKRLR